MASPMFVNDDIGYGILEKSNLFHMYGMCFADFGRFLPTSLLRPLYQMCLITSFEPIILCELISVHTRVSRFRRDRSTPRPPTGSQLQEREAVGVHPTLVSWVTPRCGRDVVSARPGIRPLSIQWWTKNQVSISVATTFLLGIGWSYISATYHHTNPSGDI